MTKHLSRRTVLGTLAGGVVGATAVAASSRSAEAAVRLEQLTVTGGEHEIRSVESVTLSGEVGYRFDVPDSQPTPSLFQVSVRVGESETEIDNPGGRASSRDSSGVLQATGDVLEAPGFAAGDFAPSADGPVTVDVPVLVVLEVVGDNQTLATASQRDTANVEVTQAGYDAALHGSVGGELSVDVSGE